MDTLLKCISKEEFSEKRETDKLLDVLVPNFYYCLDMKYVIYYFSSNKDAKSIIIKKDITFNKVFLGYDDVVYVFECKSGKIALAAKLQNYISEAIFLNEHIIVVGETVLYVIENKFSSITHIERVDDSIVRIGVRDRVIEVLLLNSKVYRIIF